MEKPPAPFVNTSDHYEQSSAESNGGFRGGVLLPDGRVLFVPLYADRIVLYDPIEDKLSKGKDDLSKYAGKYAGGVLLPDGKVVLVPTSTDHVGLYDPIEDKWIASTSVSDGSYSCGVPLPDGRVALDPLTHTSVVHSTSIYLTVY